MSQALQLQQLRLLGASASALTSVLAFVLAFVASLSGLQGYANRERWRG